MSTPAGYTDSGKTAQCPACGGKGYNYVQQTDTTYIAVQCASCSGTGSIPVLVATP